ncbi:MAG: hypothetical protein JO021_09340 [Alphaproteobacteria bacterium]|nr:hypothetical protein [Alphaproteobacteria bacterium]
MIALAGCATDNPNDFFRDLFGSRPVEVAAPTPPPHPHPVAATPAATQEPEAKPKRPVAKKAAPASETAARAGDTQTAVAAAPTQGDLAGQAPQLIGLTQQETVTLLGAPAAQWDRPPARVWHYQGPDCAVDVFFYLDVSRNEFSALRYTAAGGDAAAQPAGQTCLTRIRDVAQRK